jgi:hypothetical protein
VGSRRGELLVAVGWFGRGGEGGGEVGSRDRSWGELRSAKGETALGGVGVLRGITQGAQLSVVAGSCVSRGIHARGILESKLLAPRRLDAGTRGTLFASEHGGAPSEAQPAHPRALEPAKTAEPRGPEAGLRLGANRQAERAGSDHQLAMIDCCNTVCWLRMVP